MTNRLPATSPLTLARLAGLLYLLVVPLGIIGTLYIPSLLVVRGNAAATAANLAASESLYRLGIVLDMLARREGEGTEP